MLISFQYFFMGLIFKDLHGITPFTKVLGQNDELQKDSKGKIYERTAFFFNSWGVSRGRVHGCVCWR